MSIFNKSNKIVATIFVLTCLLFSCKDEQDLPSAQGQLQLKIQPADLASSSGRITTDMTPDAIVLTLVGNGTETRKTLDLIDFSGEYTTNPISLSVGNYEVTEFIVINSDDEVIYAVPRKDSEFGSLVSQPLPISITINSEQVQTLAPQVISVAGKTASEFGYASFGFDVLPSFRITTMGMVDGVAELITPRLVLTQASDTLLDYELKDAINEVPYVDNGVDLRLTLMQHGFARYSQVFSADSLANFSEEPLFIILEKAFTFEMSAFESNSGKLLQFSIGCNKPSNLIIDWGTNTDYDTLACFPNSIIIQERSVSNEPSYFISITGDIGDITVFKNSNCSILNIHLANLMGLENLSMDNSSIPNLDLSKNQSLLKFFIKNDNQNLQILDFRNLTQLREIKVRDKNLNRIFIEGCDSISSIDLTACKGLEYPYIGKSDTDYFPLSISEYINLDSCNINQIFEMAFLYRIYDILEYYKWDRNIEIRDVTLSFLGNSLPNSEALQAKKHLEGNYNWTILFSEE